MRTGLSAFPACSATNSATTSSPWMAAVAETNQRHSGLDGEVGGQA
jgi:hypothetical protein